MEDLEKNEKKEEKKEKQEEIVVEEDSDDESGNESEDDKKKSSKKKKKKHSRVSHSLCALPGYHRFKQQTLPYRIIIMTPFPFMLCLLFLAVCCLIVGSAFVASTSLVVETPTYRYDNLCRQGDKCTFRFEIEEDMDKPVYFYYQLDGYYQNHRRYKNSVSYTQLRDVDVNKVDSLDECKPKVTRKDGQRSPSDVYLPCGLQAYSFFNDTFVMTYENGVRLDQSSEDVAWDSDKKLFKDPGVDTKGIRVVDSFENPNLKVWMKIAAFPKFLKLYSIIDQDIKKGTYKIEITNWYPTYDLENVKKYFKLSTTEWNGGKNYFLGVALLAVGVILLLLCAFVCLKEVFWPRQLGNIAYLDWSNRR